MLSDLNSGTRFEILPSFRNFLATVWKDLHTLIFRPPLAVAQFEIAGSTDKVFFQIGQIPVSRAFGSKTNQKMVCDPQNKFSTSVRDGLMSHVTDVWNILRESWSLSLCEDSDARCLGVRIFAHDLANHMQSELTVTNVHRRVWSQAETLSGRVELADDLVSDSDLTQLLS